MKFKTWMEAEGNAGYFQTNQGAYSPQSARSSNPNDPNGTGMDQQTGQIYDKALWAQHSAKSRNDKQLEQQAKSEIDQVIDQNPNADPAKLVQHAARKLGFLSQQLQAELLQYIQNRIANGRSRGNAFNNAFVGSFIKSTANKLQ